MLIAVESDSAGEAVRDVMAEGVAHGVEASAFAKETGPGETCVPAFTEKADERKRMLTS